MRKQQSEDDSLDRAYKIAKIVGIIAAILVAAFSAVAGIAVGHSRIDSLQESQIEIKSTQMEAKAERAVLRSDINNLVKSITEIQTDVKWMRLDMEKKP